MIQVSCRGLWKVYVGSPRLQLKAIEYRTGHRVVKSSDAPRAQMERIKMFADAVALDEWHCERTVVVGAWKRMFECHGVLLFLMDESPCCVRVERLGCPLRNLAPCTFRWQLPAIVGDADSVEHVVMDPGSSTVLFVIDGVTEAGIG